MNRRQFLTGFAAATLGSAGVAMIPESKEPGTGKKSFAGLSAADRRRARFANVTLTTHEGKQVRFYDDLIKGKTVLLNMFYVNCVGETTCPMATANLVKVQKLLGKRVGKDIFIYSITLDPEHDTPEVLRNYAKGFGVKPGWLFLTGTKEDIEALRLNLGYYTADPVKDKDRTTHIGMLRYGIEPLERWAGCPSLSRPEAIVKYLSWMEPGGERPARRPQKPATAAG